MCVPVSPTAVRVCGARKALVRMPRKGSPYGPSYQRARERLLGGSPRCSYCPAPATTADHVPALRLHSHRDGSGCCRLVPSCAACQLADGRGGWGLVNSLKRGSVREAVPVPELEEPVGVPVDAPVWRVPWLADLLDVPGDAMWPRFMSLPHPRAVGSLGVEFEEFVRRRRGGLLLRWWQRLVVRRLLEVDADGVLVWDTLLLTVARQVGKTWLFRELLFWRIHQGARFGGQQGALHTARELSAARKEFVKVARALSEQRDEYGVIVTKTQEEIRWLGDDSAWVVRTVDAAYGETAGLVVVDEAWDVQEHEVDEGIDPTRVSVPQSQLLLTSTAHRKASRLMIRRRLAAIAAIVEGLPAHDEILLEWSAPRHFALDDVEGWRMASPSWTPQRERLLTKNVARALAGGPSEQPGEPDPIESFRAQWLNQWPLELAVAGRGELLIEPGRWDALKVTGDDPLALWVAVADNFGRGAGVAAVAELGDGRFEVDAWLCADRELAFTSARETLAGFDVPGVFLVEPGLSSAASDAEAAIPADVRFGLPLVRQFVDSGRLVHDETHELDVQVAECRVKSVSGGLALASPARSDLVRAMALALRAAVVEAPLPVVHLPRTRALVGDGLGPKR